MNEIIAALIGLAGSAVGSFAGIAVNSTLMQYRIQQLEKKVEKHNSVIERTCKLEDQNELWSEKFKVVNHRIEDLERAVDK